MFVACFGSASMPTTKLVSDPQPVEKVHDIVRRYLNPPGKAVVFCIDEKTAV
jgi:hypothetical protein